MEVPEKLINYNIINLILILINILVIINWSKPLWESINDATQLEEEWVRILWRQHIALQEWQKIRVTEFMNTLDLTFLRQEVLCFKRRHTQLEKEGIRVLWRQNIRESTSFFWLTFLRQEVLCFAAKTLMTDCLEQLDSLAWFSRRPLLENLKCVKRSSINEVTLVIL